jgi:hypothetical protein
MLEFKARSDDVLAKGCQVVLVGSTDFLDEPVEAEAFESA